MRLTKTSATLGAVCALLASTANAHPGHDHSAASADLIHLFWIAPAVIAIAFLAYKIFKKNALKED